MNMTDNTQNLLAMARSQEIITKETESRKEVINGITPEADVLLERVITAGITSDTFNDLSDDDVLEIFEPKDGAHITLDISASTSIKEFRRSFIGMLLVNDEADKIYETENKQLMEAINQDLEEFNSVVEQYGDFNNFTRMTLLTNIENATDEFTRKKQEELLRYLDYSENANNIIEAVKLGDKRNFMSDFTIEHKQIAVYKRYLSVIKKMGSNVDLTKYNNIEKQIPGYEKYENMFLFAVIRTVAYSKDYSQNQKFYLANLSMVVQEFRAGTMSNERKERFTTAVKSVIDIITK